MDVLEAPFTIVTLAATVLISVAAFSRPSLYAKLMFRVDAVVHDNEFWRLFTTSLVHADWMHLAFNVFSLFSFGMFIEAAMGTWRFAMLYVLGVVFATFTSLMANRNNMDYRAVGASGGVCAVIGCATALFPTMGMYFFIIPVAIPAWIMGSAFIAYSILGMRANNDSIGHVAHLGGEVFGLGFAVAFYPAVVLEQWWYLLLMLLAGAVAWLVVKRRYAY